MAPPLSWSSRRKGKEVAMLEQKKGRAFLNEELSEL